MTRLRAAPALLLSAFLSAVFLCPAALVSCATAPASAAASAAALEWYEVGNAWYDAGKWERAGEAYSRALALDPKLDAASFNILRALAEGGDYEGALRAADLLLSKDPGNVRVLAAKAYVLSRRGEPAAALAVYEELLSLAPFAPDAVYNAAWLKAEAGDEEGAAADLRRLVEARPEDSGALALYARLLARLGRREEALAAHERLKAQGKADAAALERLGGLYAEGRDFAKALEALAAATAADGKRASAWFALARLRLVEAEDGKGGLEALAKALEAGFADKAAAAALLGERNLVEREAVSKALREKGLAP